jgi:hypothetical protein
MKPNLSPRLNRTLERTSLAWLSRGRRSAGSRLDVLPTDPDTCLRRIMERPIGEDIKRSQHASVAKRHATYKAGQQVRAVNG